MKDKTTPRSKNLPGERWWFGKVGGKVGPRFPSSAFSSNCPLAAGIARTWAQRDYQLHLKKTRNKTLSCRRQPPTKLLRGSSEQGISSDAQHRVPGAEGSQQPDKARPGRWPLPITGATPAPCCHLPTRSGVTPAHQRGMQTFTECRISDLC